MGEKSCLLALPDPCSCERTVVKGGPGRLSVNGEEKLNVHDENVRPYVGTYRDANVRTGRSVRSKIGESQWMLISRD